MLAHFTCNLNVKQSYSCFLSITLQILSYYDYHLIIEKVIQKKNDRQLLLYQELMKNLELYNWNVLD